MIRTVQECVRHYLPHISSLIILKCTRMCIRNEQWKDELKLLETIVYLSKEFQRRLMDRNMHRYQKNRLKLDISHVYLIIQYADTLVVDNSFP